MTSRTKKRSLLTTALGLVLLAALAGGGFWLFHITPSWYRPLAHTAAQWAQAATRAEAKLLELRNWAAESHARLSATRSAQKNGAPTTAAVPVTISFEEEELNGFFDKWSRYAHWQQHYGKLIENPTLVLRNGSLILAAWVPDMNTVVSAHFRPQVDDQGRLCANLVRVMGGRLPMPKAVFSAQSKRLAALVQYKLPKMQQQAHIDASGAANASAIGAAMAKLLLSTLDREPAEATFFLPLLDQPRGMPVRLTAVRIENKTLTMTVETLNEPQRKTLLDRIRQPYGKE